MLSRRVSPPDFTPLILLTSLLMAYLGLRAH